MADDTQKSIFSAFGGTTEPAPQSPTPQVTAAIPPVSPDAGGNIFAAFSSQPIQQAQTEPTGQLPETPAPKHEPGSIFAAFDPKISSLSEPEYHKVESKSEPSDPNDPWYKKLWDAANAPLFDADTAKKWFGWDVDHWNGWGKGLFDLASGLTSPLQIALAVGTFGSGSLLESGGVAALKAAGMGAEEIEAVTKGSGILAKAIRMGHDEETAFKLAESYGVNSGTLRAGLDTLAKSGMSGEAMLANGVIRRTGASMLRAAGTDIATAEKVANWTQFAVDAGFTAQNAYGAAVAAPQVLDAIKEGDYEAAKRLAIDAAGSGLFALAGSKQLHQHAGELMTNAEAAAGLRVKPSDENVKLMKLLEPIERERVVAGEREKTWEQSARKEFDFKRDKNWVAGGSSESDLRARFYRESNAVEKIDNMAAWHDAIADAAGRPDEKIVKSKAEIPTEHYDLQDMTPEGRHDFINKNINFRLQATDLDAAKAEVKKKLDADLLPKSLDRQIVSYTDKDGVKRFGVKTSKFSVNSVDDVVRLQQQAAQKLFGKDYADLTDFKDKMAAIREATNLQNEERAGKPPDPTFPPNIQDAIDSGNLKNKSPEYINQLLKASDPRLITEDEIKYAKHVGLHFDETGTKAVSEEALQGLADSYVTRVFKDPENDSVRKFRSVATSPNFSVDTAMARRRVFETTLEGILKGHELANHDMVALAAHNGNEFSRIVSNRQALSRIRGIGARASDGRPMAAVSGTGHVVESVGPDGQPVNPATIINPKAMQSIRMSDKVVEGLKKNISRPGDEGKYAYRLRDIGEQGVSPEGHAQLTTRFDDMARWWESRSDKPQEMVRVPLENLKPEDFEQKAGPNGGQWVTLKRPLDETELQRLPKDHAPRKSLTELDRLIKQNRVVEYGQDKSGSPLYAWTVNDYKTVDNPAFRGWKVPTVDTNGNPVFVQGELKVHPEAHEYLQRRFETDEGLKLPGKKYLMRAGGEAKGWLLAFSPFHFVQEGLRAVMTGISPIGNEHFDPNNPMHVLAAEKGVWATKDYKGVKAFEDGLIGHSKAMAKIPVLREIQHWTQSMLFDRYIPGLKLRAFERVYEANRSLHPEWTSQKLGNESAAEVNERFGGIDYKRMGRSAAAMDLARLTTLAPDWLESEMRFMKRTLSSGAEGELARRDVVKMTLGLWAAARVLNYITTGKAHNEAPFGVAYKDEDGREKVYSIRTMPGDMLHAVSDPTGFINGRMAPLLKTGLQTYTGRDEFGRKMSTNGIFVNLLKNVAPISVQSAVKQATGEDTLGINNLDQGMKAAGFTVYPYRTEAQKLAAKIASDHAEGGVIDKDKLRRHQALIHMEDEVRAGRTPLTDVYKAVENGQLHIDEVKKIQKNVQETQGFDPDMARLYSHASRAPMKELLSIWDSASNEEKAALSKLLIKRQMSYFKKSYKDMSPAERQSDPVYLRLRKMFPQSAPF